MPVLKSQDDCLFRVTKEELEPSVLLKTLLGDFEHLQLEENTTTEKTDDVLSEGEQPIPLDVSKPVLAKIVEWLRYQQVNALTGNQQEEIVKMKFDKYEMSEWESNFVDVTPAILMELIAAADYLDIGKLKDLIGRSFQNLLSGKTPPQIREILGLDDVKDEDAAVNKDDKDDKKQEEQPK